MEESQRPSKHVCLTHRGPMMISENPELDILTALADKDVLVLAKGLAAEGLRSPFTNGAFGLDERSINQAIRKMKAAGLISSRRDGNDHVYMLNKGRFHEIIGFLQNLVN